MNYLPFLVPMLMVPLSPAQSPQITPDATVPTTSSALESVQDPQLRQVLEDAVRAMKSVTELLETVQDKASADAVAGKMKVRSALLDELRFGLQYIPYPIVMQAMSEAGITQERTEAIQRRLEDNRYYFSTALAEAMGVPAHMAMELTTPTEEQLQALAQELMKAAATMPDVTGGPGLSMEQAWKLSLNNHDFPRLIATVLGDESHGNNGYKAIHDENGRLFQLHHFLITRDDKYMLIEQWFHIDLPQTTDDDASPEEPEITNDNEPAADDEPETPETEEIDNDPMPDDMEVTVEVGGEPYTESRDFTPEQKNAALREFVVGLNELTEILRGVVDTASADAAAPGVTDALRRINSVSEVISTIPGMDIIEALEAGGSATPAVFAEQGQRLEANEFYHSELLRRALTH